MNLAARYGTTTVPGKLVAPFLPSPESLVDRMLEAARVGPGDTVYDLGAGDGRIVVAAAQRFGARAMGVELDDKLFALSSARIRDLGLEPRARIVHGDLLGTDLTPATVVTLYQLPSVNEMLRPALERQLRSGARVVTLDFPVQGWEASNVLTAQLTENFKHAIYLYLISEIRKDSATMANNKGSYAATACWLELQGGPNAGSPTATAGLLKSAEGGDATADVVIEGPDPQGRGFLLKHIAGVKYDDIIVSFGTGMSRSVYEWLGAATQGLTQQRGGAVVIQADQWASRLTFVGAISEIGFPPLDASSTEPVAFTLKITPVPAPGITRREFGGTWEAPVAFKESMMLANNFRLSIDGLDCSSVRRIEPLTITQPIMFGGESNGAPLMKPPGPLELPNLAITLSETGSETFRQWHEAAVIGGRGNISEKNGTLEYLDSNNVVLFTLAFRNLGIFKLTTEKYEQGIEMVRRAAMYCEKIQFYYAVSAAAAEADATTLQYTILESPAPIPPFTLPAPIAPFASPDVAWKQKAALSQGTLLDSPAYGQPFTSPDVAWKQKAALSPDLITPPLRPLGRPLKFRS